MTRRILVFSIAGLSGWLLFLALAWISKDRIISRIEGVFTPPGAEFKARLAARLVEARSPWLDTRSTILLLGDSHIEMGRWYDFFRGRYPLRNAGLSQARIKDTREIAAAMKGQSFTGVIVMCGINDLGAAGTVDACLHDYTALLSELRRLGPDGRVMVLSVLPVVVAPLDDNAAKMNRNVRALNSGLENICRQSGIRFINLTPDMMSGESLRQSLSWDGLHLNEEGYRIIVRKLEPAIQSFFPGPEGKSTPQ